MSGCGAAMRQRGTAAEGAVGAARPGLTASHDVMALRLETLGQVAAAAEKGRAVAQVSASPMQSTCRPAACHRAQSTARLTVQFRTYLAMKPPAPVTQMRSFFSGQ